MKGQDDRGDDGNHNVDHDDDSGDRFKCWFNC